MRGMAKRWVPAAAIVATVAIGCSSEDTTPSPGTGGSGGTDTSSGGSGGVGGSISLPSQSDHDRLAGFLEDLSAEPMKGRLTGSPSGAVAEQYVLAALGATGFTVETQDVPLPIFDVGSPIELAIVDGNGNPTTTFTYLDEYREVMFAGSGLVTGDLAFVGHGTDPEYQALDVTGRVVAVLASSSAQGSAFKLAHDKGAAGVLFVPVGNLATADAQLGPIYQPSLFALGDPVDPALLADGFPALLVHVGAVQKLLGKTGAELLADPTPFDALAQVRIELHGTGYPDATCKNILAFRPGAHPALGSEVIGVGAHYDHIGVGGDGMPFFGASDNASGAASVLELAYMLDAFPIAPDRTVLLGLWCGEEQDLYGSQYYVHNPRFPLASTALYVNLDNIADPPGPYLVRTDPVPIQADFLAPSAADPIQEQHIGFQCGSDECPFFIAGVTFLRYLDFGVHGHTHVDTFANADLAGLGRVTDEVLRGVEATAYQLP